MDDILIARSLCGIAMRFHIINAKKSPGADLIPFA
jgi:hypothetical protein